MATNAEVAYTAKQLRGELARRIDQLLAEGDINSSAATCLEGIVEGLASLEEAIRGVNGKPSTMLEAWGEEDGAEIRYRPESARGKKTKPRRKPS